MEPTEKDIEATKEKFPSKHLHQIDITHGGEDFSVLITLPEKPEWVKFITEVNATEDYGKKLLAHESLILATAKWPDRETIKEFLGRKFAAVTDITGPISEMVGGNAQVKTKKL